MLSPESTYKSSEGPVSALLSHDHVSSQNPFDSSDKQHNR